MRERDVIRPVGLVVSSGGGAFAAAITILRAAGQSPDVRVVTDRACGAERVCDTLGVPYQRIEEPDRDRFSARAAAQLYETWGCGWSVLFFTRLVSAPLFASRALFNIHPSLLPAYPGLRAVSRLHADGGQVLGATAHRVTEGLDEGPIVAQIAHAVPPGATLPDLQRRSFAQKVHLLLALLESDARPPVWSPAPPEAAAWTSAPLRATTLRSAWMEYMQREGIAVALPEEPAGGGQSCPAPTLAARSQVPVE